MAKIARRLMLLLIACAIVGGTAGQLARAAEQLAPIAGAPCGMAMAASGMDHGTPMKPCKGMTPECIKQMGCLTDVAVPARFVSAAKPVIGSGTVEYWPGESGAASFTPSPDPLPPRTI